MGKTQLLKDPLVFPSQEVLSKALGPSFALFTEFLNRLRDTSIETEWRYYNDGKAWLAKNMYKKKTVFWLSVWDGFFKVSLFFTDKTYGGVMELPVGESFKTFEPVWAKLRPLVISVDADTELSDLLKVIQYKQHLK